MIFLKVRQRARRRARARLDSSPALSVMPKRTTISPGETTMKFRSARARRLAIAAAFCATGANAQTDARPQALEPVVVTATRTERDPLDVPASVDRIERAQIRDTQLRVNLSESLARVPGVVVLNRQNYAQDLQISMRGFGARSTFGVRGVRLHVDGIPATFPDGQGQVSHFPLNAAESIEVLRGPFSALYGNSSGGVIALTTELKPQPLRLEPSAAVGAHGTWRLGMGAAGGEEPYAFALDAARFRTEGFRPHSAARRDTLNIRAGFFDTPAGRVRVSLNAVEMPDSQDPLGLTRTQFDANPDQTTAVAEQFNTRKTTRQTTTGIDAHTELGEGLTLNSALWLGTRGVTQFQSIPPGAQTPATHPGGVIDFDRTFGGADVRIALERGAFTTTAGLNFERMDEDRRGYQNFVGTTLGVLGELRRDEKNRIEAVDPYVQTEWRLGERWRLHAGVRGSEVRFRSRDQYLLNGDDSGSASFSGANPTAGIVFKATPRFSYYASYGRGFETPTLNELAYRPDGSAGLNTDLRAARSHNVEVGVKAALGSLRYTLALFAIETTDDIVVRTNVGGRSSFANVAKTKRDGAEASLDWQLTPSLTAYGSLAYVDARFDTAFTTTSNLPPVPEGNKLPGVPEYTAFAELKYRAGWADLSLEARGQAPMYVDDRNTDRAAGYGVMNAAIARTLELGAVKPRAFLRVVNLFDKRYAGSVIVNEGNSRFFEPAPGRTWLVGIDAPL
jgi:iron complex outermembrane receptor protein